MPLDSLLAGLGLVISVFLVIVSAIAYGRSKKFRVLLASVVFLLFALKFIIYLLAVFTPYLELYFLIDVVILVAIYFSLVGRVKGGGETP